MPENTTHEYVVDDMCRADLDLIAWSGSSLHLKSVGQALARVPSGEVEYLVVRDPEGQPVCKAGVWPRARFVGANRQRGQHLPLRD